MRCGLMKVCYTGYLKAETLFWVAASHLGAYLVSAPICLDSCLAACNQRQEHVSEIMEGSR